MAAKDSLEQLRADFVKQNERIAALEARVVTLEAGSSRAGRRPARSPAKPGRKTSIDRKQRTSTPPRRTRKGTAGMSNGLDRLRQKKSADELAADTLAKDARNAKMHSYRFGSRTLFVMCPNKYPTPEEAGRPVEGVLELEYAYGYNGRGIQQRQNMYLTDDGCLIYYLAAVGIVHDVAKGVQRFYFGHNDDITCIDYNSKTGLVASGQTDPKDTPGQGKDLPKILIWDYKTCQTLKVIDNASWGEVKKVRFSKFNDGYMYSMGGDDNQSISIWDTTLFNSKKTIESPMQKRDLYREEAFGMACAPIMSKEDSVDEAVFFGRRKVAYMFVREGTAKTKKVPIMEIKTVNVSKAEKSPKETSKAFLCCEFLPSGGYLIAAPTGHVFLCDGALGKKCFQPHRTAIGDITMLAKNQVMFASFDGTLSTFIWDEDNYELVEGTRSKKLEIANSDFEMAPRVAAASADGDCIYIGTKSNQIIQYNRKDESLALVVDGHDDQVWGLATHPTEPLICSGGYDNCIKLWDHQTRKNVETYMFEQYESAKTGNMLGEKVVAVAWSDDGKWIACGTESSKVALLSYDATTTPRLKLTDKQVIPPKSANAAVEAVDNLRFSADSCILGVCHMDSQSYMFTIGEDGKMTRWSRGLRESAAPSHIRFNADSSMCSTFTRDYEISYWSLDKNSKKSKRVSRIPDPDTCDWSGDPLIAGWDVEGLYQNEWDGTDLNDAACDPSNKFIASGDDFGWVRLHNYPAIDKNANVKYQAHSAFVVGVEWTGTGGYLATIGGNDYALFQWRLKKGVPTDEEKTQ